MHFIFCSVVPVPNRILSESRLRRYGRSFSVQSSLTLPTFITPVGITCMSVSTMLMSSEAIPSRHVACFTGGKGHAHSHCFVQPVMVSLFDYNTN